MEQNDEVLVRRVLEGDDAAFGRLVDRHYGACARYAARMLGGMAQAEDAVQETLTRAWRNLDRFEGRSTLRTWLYKIATNTSLDVIARRPKRVQFCSTVVAKTSLPCKVASLK